MTVISWNLWFRNKTMDAAIAFIARSGFDVLCLQEVPETLLARLSALPFSLYLAPESNRKLADGTRFTLYSAILSRHPILSAGTVPLPDRERSLPWRGRLFINVMVRLGLWSWGDDERTACYIDVSTPGGLVRVFNLHLALITSPAARAEEFRLALANYDAAVPTIVCGDFNTLEAPHIAILSWLFGGKFGDWLFWSRERRALERHFTDLVFENPLRGRTTHPLAHSQLDHVLLSKQFLVEHAAVVPVRHGSDHHPIRVRVKMMKAPASATATASA